MHLEISNCRRESALKRTAFVFAFFMCIYLNAQVSLKAKVVDQGEKPLDFAQISVKNLQDTTNIKDTFTDKDGSFLFSLPKGSYELSVIYLGENLLNKKLTLSKDKNIGIIKIKTNNQIESVTVSGKKPLIEHKIDRLIFNVENSVAASGGDALDALRVTPGLRVEDDKITLIGKSDLRVMIDGRMVHLSGEQLIDYLKSLSSDDIKSVEVITAPPANYEAEGNSGLLNIVLKKTKKNSWSNTVRSVYTQTTYPAFGLGNTFNYRKNRWRMLASIDTKKGNRRNFTKGTVYYPNRLLELDDNTKTRQNNFSGRLGLDYDLSAKSSVGFLYHGSLRYPNSKGQTLSRIFNLDNSLKSKTISTGNSHRTRKNHALNAHYIQKADTLGKKISMDVDYFTYKERIDRNFDSHDFSSQSAANTHMQALNSSIQQIDNYSAKIDINHPTKWLKLNYGAKVNFTNTNNQIRYFDKTSGKAVLDPSKSNDFKYKEGIQALYASASKSFGEKWETKMGLRLETTQTKGASQKSKPIKRNYIKFFPTFYLAYKLNKNNSLNLNYSRRIQRPRFWEVRSFRFYINPTSYEEGNPFLQPSFFDNMQLTHSYKNKLISSIYLNITSGGSGQVPNVTPDKNILIFTRENYYSEYNYGWSESYTVKPFTWWQSQNRSQLYYVQSKPNRNIDLGTPMQNGFAYYFSTNNSFTLNKKKTLTGEINFWYNSSQKYNIAKIGSAYNLSAGLKVSLFANKFQGTVMVHDIFKSRVGYFTTFTGGIKQVYNSNWDSRYLNFSLSYRFGNKKIKVKQREGSNREERRRTN